MASTKTVHLLFISGLAAILGFVAIELWPGSLVAANALSPAMIKVGGATIEVSFARGNLDLPQTAILRWATRAAEAVTAYYGHFAVPTVQIQVHPATDRAGVFNGTTWGYRGGLTRISVGEHTRQEQLDSDWMLTHELTHMAFPDVPDQHHWIEEGLATYVEPIARAQAGQLSPARVWADMVHDMPNGEPGPNDRGLDHTQSWGRTYWGGAMFCLMADVRIRECSHNRKGLQDALRGIVAAGGTIDAEWPIVKVFKIGDEAAGCSALGDLYAQMKDAPVTVDLNAMWKRLGVEPDGRTVSFNDQAPLAEVRKAITAHRE